MIALLLAAQVVVAAEPLRLLPCYMAQPGQECIAIDDEGFASVQQPDPRTLMVLKHDDPWWLKLLAFYYGAAVVADATTSAYVFGARIGHERNVLYRDVQHHPFRFGLRRAAIGAAVGTGVTWLHVKGGPKGRLLSGLALAALGTVTMTIAIRNERLLPDR